MFGATRRPGLVLRRVLRGRYQRFQGIARFADDLSGLPPALIITAEHDTLRDEGKAYADRLESAGVSTKYSCYSGMIHGFLQMAGLVDQAQAAIDEISVFTRTDSEDPTTPFIAGKLRPLVT